MLGKNQIHKVVKHLNDLIKWKKYVKKTFCKSKTKFHDFLSLNFPFIISRKVNRMSQYIETVKGPLLRQFEERMKSIDQIARLAIE